MRVGSGSMVDPREVPAEQERTARAEREPTAADPREALAGERERALRRVSVLEREFAELAEAAATGGTDDEHDPEGATLAFERQHTAALLDQARNQVAAIDAALERLAAGRYGVCERCGQPIGAGRLAARPAAVTCVRCAAAG